MNRRQFLTSSALVGMATLPAARLLSRDFRPTADAKFTLLRGNVGYYTDRGGTIGVYLPGGRPEGGVMVDTQFPAQAGALLERLRERGALTRLAVLVNTHHHGDHTGGNAVIAPLADTHVGHRRAKENLVAALAEKQKSGSLPPPATVFDTAWSTNLPDGKEAVSLQHFGPAHTGGDAVAFFENANVAHLGDLLFNRRFPYIDPAAGGDIVNWPEVLRQIRRTFSKDTLYIFGHAAEEYPVVGTSSDLKAFELYLKSLRKYVRKERKKGTTLAALQAKTETVPGAPEWKFGEQLRDVNLEVMWAALDRR